MNWWKNSVIYQIYPRSFQDSNNDGIGDIPGIISHLDYLEKLGVDVIWLGPVYQSPGDDNGYDISDYQAINPEFGTMEDLDNLINEAKKRNIGIVMDLVVNHTSDEHEWFLEAKKGKDNPYRDYYIWRDPVDGGVPNDMKSTFSGPAWEFDEASGQYYLHLYSKKQPDLNWENEEMRNKIYEMMTFWLEKGIAGFRMDVIDHIGKVPDEKIITNGPKLHDYIQEMNHRSFGNYDVMTVGETWSATPADAPLYSDPQRKELSMVFQFEHIGLDEQPGKSKWDLKPLNIIDLKKTLTKWQTEIGENSWNSLFWNNHDTPRIVSRWGNDNEYRVESAKLFAILLHLMKGTPYIYQGEEIGMTNRELSDISQARDIETINMYHDRLGSGYDEAAIFESLNAKSRDNARTPMQWKDTKNAGFTTNEPWIPANPNHETVNVANALEDPNSVFFTYQKLIQLRKQNPLIVHGNYTLLLPDHETIFAYEREYEGEKWVVVANLSDFEARLDLKTTPTETIISNYNKTYDHLAGIKLEPYEAFAVKVLS
ncbi:glycoside hydrolase family 13 protein [Jeotgalibaca sp. A122]|uniref:glycoside hydrolase family 13 protein n=1 Tax=Jeotgalibaca sp. A122 TaxID=3457322 RepID=UPI003FD35C1B